MRFAESQQDGNPQEIAIRQRHLNRQADSDTLALRRQPRTALLARGGRHITLIDEESLFNIVSFSYCR
jgi:hypothetical protein